MFAFVGVIFSLVLCPFCLCFLCPIFLPCCHGFPVQGGFFVSSFFLGWRVADIMDLIFLDLVLVVVCFFEVSLSPGLA